MLFEWHTHEESSELSWLTSVDMIQPMYSVAWRMQDPTTNPFNSYKWHMIHQWTLTIDTWFISELLRLTNDLPVKSYEWHIIHQRTLTSDRHMYMIHLVYAADWYLNCDTFNKSWNSAKTIYATNATVNWQVYTKSPYVTRNRPHESIF